VNVLERGDLDAVQLSELAELMQRVEEHDGHPALAEPQRIAASRQDLGGDGTRALLAYDGGALVGCAILTPGSDGSTTVHVAVAPDEEDGEAARGALVADALGRLTGPVRLWAMRATERDDQELLRWGFAPERDVVQMRVALPLPEPVVATARPVVTRPFEPGRDDEAWLSINNRAFADHPEQGSWTARQLDERVQAEWFDPYGFLIADDPDGGAMIGSCWTKVHRHGHPVLGEIYVISVNPDRQGEGWGRALTVAGLVWLAGQGVRTGMLYTDATNTEAEALYGSLGFEVDHVDRSYLHAP
jgi:mycothiol synthase